MSSPTQSTNGTPAASGPASASTVLAPGVPPARRRRRRALIIAGVVAGILFLFILLIPTLLGTGPGRALIVSQINSRIHGRVAIDSVSLGWFTGQRVRGLTLFDPGGATVVHVDAVEVPGLSLLGALLGGRDLGTVKVVKPVVNAVADGRGTLNLLQAIEPTGAAPGARPAANGTPRRHSAAATALRLDLDVVDAQCTFTTPRGKKVVKVSLSGMAIKAKARDLRHISVEVAAKMAQGQSTGTISSSIAINDLFDPGGALQLDKATINAAATLDAIPVATVGELAQQSRQLAAILGPALTLTFQAKGSLTFPDVMLDVRSDNLRAHLAAARKGDQMAVAPNAMFHLHVTPETWTQLLAATGTAPSTLLEPFDVDATLRSLVLPRRGGVLDLAHVALDARLVVTPIMIDAKGPNGRVSLHDTAGWVLSSALGDSLQMSFDAAAEQSGQTGPVGTVHFDADVEHALTPDGKPDWGHVNAQVNGAIAALPLAVIDQIARDKGRLVAALGPMLSTKLTVDMRPSADAQSVSGDVTLEVHARNLNVELGSAVAAGADKAALSGAHLTADIQPDLVAAVAGPDAALAEPVHVVLSADRLEYPLNGAGPGQARVGLKATVDRLIPANVPGDARSTLRNLKLEVPDTLVSDKLAATLTADLDGEQGKGTLTLQVTVTQPLSGNRDIDAHLDISNLPIGLVDALGGQHGRMVALLGGTFKRVSVSVTPGDAHIAQVAASVDAQDVKLDMHGSVAPDLGLTLQGTADLMATTDLLRVCLPAGLGERPDAELDHPQPVHVAVDGIDLATVHDHPGQFDPRRSSINVALTAPDLTVNWPREKQAATFTGLHASIAAKDLTRTISIDASGQVETSAGDGAVSTASFTSATQVQGLGFRGNHLDLTGLAVNSQTSAKGVVVPMLDALLGRQGQLTIVLGNTLDMDVGAHYTPGSGGTVDLNITSPNVSTSFQGKLDKGMVLHLDHDATASLMVTPALANAYLSSLNPILTGVQSTGKPIQLTVAKDVFTARLRDLNLNALAIDGRLELGTLRVHRASNMIVEGLILAMRALGSPMPKDEVFDASFTPLTFHIANGVLTTNDVWMYTGRLLLGTQARVTQRPGEKRPHADIVLGLPAETLGMIPHLAAPPGAVFELEAAGPANRIKPDYIGFIKHSVFPLLAGRIAGGHAAKFFEALPDDIAKAIGDNNAGTGDSAPGGGTHPGPATPIASGQSWVNHAWPNKPKVALEAPEKSDDSIVNDAGSFFGGLLNHKKKKKKESPPPDAGEQSDQAPPASDDSGQ